MRESFNAETWKELLGRFSTFEGSVSNFCKENNMSKSRFYYYKKRFEQPNMPVFHAIALKKEEPVSKTTNNDRKTSKDIRIEIGKANIFVPASEIGILKEILKELAGSC